MNAIVFDPLKLSKALQTGFAPAQAEKPAVALAERAFDTIATRADVFGLKVEIAELKVEMAKDFSLLRADLARWVVTAIAFNLVAVAGLVIALAKVFGK